MDSETLLRLNIKQGMIDLRCALFGKALCDYCRVELGTEMHEMIARRSTVNHPEYRKASFEPPICSLLCPFCHATKAPTKKGAKVLLDFNVRLYGEEKIIECAIRIPERLWRSYLSDLAELCHLRRDG